VLAKAAVELHPLLNQRCEHLAVSAAFCLGDKRAQLALTALKMTALEGVQSILNLLGR